MLGNGKLDVVELMAIDHYEKRERQEKLDYIVQTVLESDEENFDITSLCHSLKIRLTPAEFNWILEQVNDD
jgi:hypothetical protein